MTRSASATLLGPEFDAFLFAPIGEDKNGMLLSVLSALARLDVDPWQEAAQLARLPAGPAIQRLAALIAALPGVPPAQFDAGTIAARLVALLPRLPAAAIPSPVSMSGSGARKNSAILYVIVVIVMLIAQCLAARLQPPAQVDNTKPAPVGAVVPQMPPPDSGR